MEYEARFLLEMHTPGAPITSFLLPLVNEYTPELRPAPVVRFGIAGARPRTYNAPFRDGTVRVRGQSGFADRLATTADGRDTVLGGVEHYREMEAFLRTYQDAVATHENAFEQNWEQSPRLVFRALWRGDSFYVLNPRLRPVQSTREHRFTIGYSLELDVVGVVGKDDVTEFDFLIEDARQAKAVESVKAVLGTAVDGGRSFLAGLTASFGDEATGTALRFGDGVVSPERIADSSGFGASSFADAISSLPGELESLRAPLKTLQERIYEAHSLVQTVGSAAQFPGQIVSGVIRACETTVETIRHIVSLPDNAREAVRDAALLLGHKVEAIWDAFMGLFDDITVYPDPSAAGRRIIAGADRVAATATRSVTLGTGETLFDLAWRMFGDVERWHEIAELNEMSDPTALPDGTPLGPGVKLLVPALDGTDFGVDALWSFDADDFVIAPSKEDIAAAEGPINFMQGLRRRANTERDEIPVYKDYGMRPVVGEALSTQTPAAVASDIVEQFRRDRRVADIRRVVVTEGGDGVLGSFDVYPFGVEPFRATNLALPGG